MRYDAEGNIIAEIELTREDINHLDIIPESEEIASLNRRIQKVNRELAGLENHGDKTTYLFAIASGLLSGALDSILFQYIVPDENGFYFSPMKVFKAEALIKDEADVTRRKSRVSTIEKIVTFVKSNEHIDEFANDQKELLLRDLTELSAVPGYLGLVASILVHLLKLCEFEQEDDQWRFTFRNKSKTDLAMMLGAAVITGITTWLPVLAQNTDDEKNRKIPKELLKLGKLIASNPIITEFIHCVERWADRIKDGMEHLGLPGQIVGVEGLFLALFIEIAAMPAFANTKLPKLVDVMVNGEPAIPQKYLSVIESLRKQAIPVLFNEIVVRCGYMLMMLWRQVSQNHDLSVDEWGMVFPVGNRTVDRMITVASVTFNVVDTGDAAIRAAIEAEGNSIVFAVRFMARYNYLGAGRATLALIKEASYEQKLSQLIHERMLLMEEKADEVQRAMLLFKQKLEEKLDQYLMEDITAFMSGFDDIHLGLETGNSDLVIRGNNTIQQALGREAQFTSQSEFDLLMASDAPLEL